MSNSNDTMPSTFAAFIPVNQSVFTAGSHGSSVGTPTPTPATKLTQQDVTAAGIVALICLAGFAFLALTDRR
jgi:hypothetical protein